MSVVFLITSSRRKYHKSKHLATAHRSVNGKNCQRNFSWNRLPGLHTFVDVFRLTSRFCSEFLSRGTAIHLNGRKFFTRGWKLWGGKCKNWAAKNNIRRVIFANFRKAFLFTRIFFIESYLAKIFFIEGDDFVKGNCYIAYQHFETKDIISI